jgi:hypothetical protein
LAKAQGSAARAGAQAAPQASPSDQTGPTQHQGKQQQGEGQATNQIHEDPAEGSWQQQQERQQ